MASQEGQSEAEAPFGVGRIGGSPKEQLPGPWVPWVNKANGLDVGQL